jgi:para-nitrobenzyl esterase
VTEQDQAVSQMMTGYWVQFARSGKPNKPDAPHWPGYEPGSERVLEIGAEVAVRNDFLADRMAYHLKRGQEMLARSR